jgi:hypothetical protein
MTLKERIENNLTIWFLGAIVTGFVAGVGAYQGILSIAQLEVVQKGVGSQFTGSVKKLVGAKSDQLQMRISELTSEHNKRMDDLQKSLLKDEEQATYGGNVDSVKQEYVESANRIKAAIDEENRSFKDHLAALRDLETQ